MKVKAIACMLCLSFLILAGSALPVSAAQGSFLMTQKTFLTVEKMKSAIVTSCHDEQVGCDTVEVCEEVPGLVVDVVVANDWDPETIYEWRREGTDRSNVIVRWTVPEDTVPGQYRIHHYGHWKNGIGGAITPYEGISRVFTVQ